MSCARHVTSQADVGWPAKQQGSPCLLLALWPLFIFLTMASLCSHGWSETHFVVQAGLQLTEILPPLLGLKLSVT